MGEKETWKGDDGVDGGGVDGFDGVDCGLGGVDGGLGGFDGVDGGLVASMASNGGVEW